MSTTNGETSNPVTPVRLGSLKPALAEAVQKLGYASLSDGLREGARLLIEKAQQAETATSDRVVA